MDNNLENLLAQLPEKMREALSHLLPEDAESMALDYLAADEATQADIAAFFDSDGPEKVRNVYQEHVKNQDGTPTAKDLEGWM